jgi:hypothetical protein
MRKAIKCDGKKWRSYRLNETHIGNKGIHTYVCDRSSDQSAQLGHLSFMNPVL